MPRFVEREFRGFLRCGILAHGLVRVHCDECGLDRAVAALAESVNVARTRYLGSRIRGRFDGTGPEAHAYDSLDPADKETLREACNAWKQLAAQMGGGG